AEQPTVAFEPSATTGGESCRDPIGRVVALAGATLDATFNRRLTGIIGGPLGCSHILTLARLLGSTVAWALQCDRATPGAVRQAGERLFGLPLGPGSSAELLRRLDVVPPRPPVRDALLMLAPTLVQCLAALADRLLSLAGANRSLTGLGGLPDSCYMWRRDGALGRSRGG